MEVAYGENGQAFAMGWGEEGDTVAQRLYKDRIQQQENEDCGMCSRVGDMLKIQGDESPLEKKIRERFEFDDGWAFHEQERAFYGQDLVHSQGSVGSCVGAGAGLALAARCSQEILAGQPEDPYGWTAQDATRTKDHVQPFTGYHYGAGRCRNLWNGREFVGSNRSGDGSYCAAQLWALSTTGVLPSRMVETSSIPFPQSSDVRSWGNNSKNELTQHVKMGQQFLMKTTAPVRSADDLWNSIAVLKQPVMICSGWGFGPAGSADGMTIYGRRGSWAHNMTGFGAFSIGSNRYFLIKNSWGASAHREIGRKMPRGCFVITWDTAARWMPQANAGTIGELQLPDGLPDGF